MRQLLVWWVYKYGTGSRSDRVQAAIHKPLNALAAASAKISATWDDEYGTGSRSDRTQPAIHKPFNARAAAPIRVICMSRELLPQPKLFALILVLTGEWLSRNVFVTILSH
jgi:hypothetical protein